MMILDMAVITAVLMTVIVALIIGAMTVIIPALLGIQHWLFEMVDKKLSK